jgi:hypothetical protein
MKLEGRNLQPNTRGDDLRRLQQELNQLGFTLGVNNFFDSMTLLAVEQFQKKHGLNVNGIVDKETAQRINAEVDALTLPPFIVKGQVHQTDGDPANGILISAFDVDLCNQQLLGQTQTDRKGFYQIQYSAEQFSKLEKGKADLVVKVLSTSDVVLVASPISFNAPAVAEIDLTIPAQALPPLPLFDKIRRDLAPLLEDLRAEDLEENQEHQDLTFLSSETGFTKDTLARFVLAHKLVQQGIQAEFWFVLLGSSFYEYTEERSLAEQLAAILEALPSLNAIAVRKALIRGFNEKEIAETFQGNVTEWIDAFLTLVARREVTATHKVTFVKAVLEDARIQSTEKQIKFARHRDFRREVKAVQRVFKLAPTSDIAAEYFGIGSNVEPTDPNEKTLILDAVPDEQQEIWGEVENADLLETYSSDINDIIDRSVCNVRHFLQKTGLEYAELLALLDLKFINQAGDIFIQRLDISCDTDKEVIQGLGAMKLDRIHRFLRLCRKLKTWTMWELDLVIRHPRIGNGVLNEAFLVNLFYFSELKKKLGGKTTLEQVCALFNNLNTETHFTKRHEKREEGFYPSLFLNKRLINSLDLGFQLEPVTNNLPIGNHYRAPPSCPSNIGAARNRGGCEKSRSNLRSFKCHSWDYVNPALLEVLETKNRPN